MDDGQDEGLLYGQVESVFARVFAIEPTGRKVLSARLKHLRTIGVPELPRLGSGQKLLYSKDMTLVMLLAVALENIGQTPRIAGKLAKELRTYFVPEKLPDLSSKAGDLFAFIVPAGDGGIDQLRVVPTSMVFGIDPKLRIDPATAIRGLGLVFSAINLTALAAKFEEEWLVEFTQGGY